MSKLLFKIAKFVESNDLFPLEHRARAAEYLAQKVEDPIQRAEYLASASEHRGMEMLFKRVTTVDRGNWNDANKYGVREMECRVEEYKYRAQATKDPKMAAKYLAMSFSALAKIARGLAENVRPSADFPEDEALIELIHQFNRSVGANGKFEVEVEYRIQEAEALIQAAEYRLQAANNPREMVERRADIYKYRAQLIRWQRRRLTWVFRYRRAEYDNREAEEHVQEAKCWAEAVQYFYTGSIAKYFFGRIPSKARKWAKKARERVKRTKYLAKRADGLIKDAERCAWESDDPILVLKWRAQVYEYQAQKAQYHAHIEEYCEQVIRLDACAPACSKECEDDDWEYRSYRALTREVRTEVDGIRVRYALYYSQAAEYRAEAEKVYRKRLILILQGELDRIKKTKLPICSDRCFTVMGKVLEYLKFVDEQTKQTNVQIK
jgi:hypothetical protein